jgi:hypothetical protein
MHCGLPKRPVANRPDGNLPRPVQMLSDHRALMYNLIDTLAQQKKISPEEMVSESSYNKQQVQVLRLLEGCRKSEQRKQLWQRCALGLWDD